MKKLPLLLLALTLHSVIYSQNSDKKLIQMEPMAFFATPEANKKININEPDNYLLAVSIFQATNLERKKNGLPSFLPDRSLHLAGLGHAKEMIENDFFNHLHPFKTDIETPYQRISKNGGVFRITAENIALLPLFKNYNSHRFIYRLEEGTIKYYDLQKKPLEVMTYGELAKELLKEWYNSRGHRKNILSTELTHLGIGSIVIRNKNKRSKVPEVYAVQNFGTK